LPLLDYSLHLSNTEPGQHCGIGQIDLLQLHEPDVGCKSVAHDFLDRFFFRIGVQVLEGEAGKAKTDGKSSGGRKTGTRIRLTEEKETLIRQLHAEGKPKAVIARLVGLTPKTVDVALKRQVA
jgi:hypothetical protein